MTISSDSPPNPLKRQATDELEAPSEGNKHQKTCITCCETGTTFPAVSKSCGKAHSNNVCTLCWHKHIWIKVLDQAQEPVPCVQCTAMITYGDLKRVALKQDVEHYDWLVRRKHMAETGERECLADIVDGGGNRVTCHNVQFHDEATQGRVHMCGACGDRQCIRCGIAEHDGESCEEFQHRLEKEHGDEEDRTERAFQQGYMGLETIGKLGKEKEKLKKPKPCPKCGQMIERGEGCGRVTCIRCSNEFCSICGAAYYGEGSVPDIGNAAHDKTICAYGRREIEDWRCKRRKSASRKAKCGGTAKTKDIDEDEGTEVSTGKGKDFGEAEDDGVCINKTEEAEYEKLGKGQHDPGVATPLSISPENTRIDEGEQGATVVEEEVSLPTDFEPLQEYGDDLVKKEEPHVKVEKVFFEQEALFKIEELDIKQETSIKEGYIVKQEAGVKKEETDIKHEGLLAKKEEATVKGEMVVIKEEQL